jgi:spore germination cell wall hydrolase CwlJ-like protein
MNIGEHNMRTIIHKMMAILIAVTPIAAIAQESANRPTFQDCPYNTGDARTCMACAVYYEARSESKAGQIAVASVVINRSNSKKFPGNICKVVHQTNQFSWTNPKIRQGVKFNQTQWNKSILIADEVMGGDQPDPSNGALYFHNRRVKPNLGKSRQVVAVIGQHIFKK